ncbi:DUF3139 domain-containing protein [Paenibacillus sp. FSL K6-3166]|uniref:DUF3139 domain-containing protein n=1 Tax=unclassified Paenibacillus TaxID=185978 RepID=UPI0015C67127|nr:DUF3139 domain-containing protein [Paenibacillus sp. VTT E-133291]
MKKKKSNSNTLIVFSLLTIASLIIIFSYFSLTGLPNKKREIADQVKTYLINERLNNSDNIQDVNGVYSFKYGYYQAVVNFKDEPNVNYTYEKRDGVFTLIGVSNLHGNHIDETFY